MGEFMIEKGIPIPPDYRATKGRGRPARYPLADLEVGESFMVEGDSDERDRLKNAAAHAGRRQGKQFSVRTIEPGQYRCWRVA